MIQVPIFEPYPMSLSNLIATLRRGNWQVPERDAASRWTTDQRVKLLDSLLRGYPIGSIVVWKTSAHQLKSYESLSGVPVDYAPEPGTGMRTYVLDGYERIWALFDALVPRSGGDRYFFDPEDEDDESPIKCVGEDGDVPPHWFPLSSARGPWSPFYDGLYRAGQDDLASRCVRVSNLFTDYPVQIVKLVGNDKDVVAEAVRRINANRQ